MLAVNAQFLTKYIEKFIRNFNKLTYTKKNGFIGYVKKDLTNFLENPAEFELKFKKIKGKHILYGPIHIKTRQSFFNNLPLDLRLNVFGKKLSNFKLLPILQDYFQCFCTSSPKFPTVLCLLSPDSSILSSEPSLVPSASCLVPCSIIDVKDIGIAHSIYLITVNINNKTFKCVIKRKDVNYQEFYTKILNLLNWPSYFTKHYIVNNSGWEITEYLGNNSLFKIIENPKINNADIIITDLAKQSALGDVLGHGDRHLSNYMFKNQKIFPIDISYLFWEDNEYWIKTYIQGGIYEFNFLQLFLDDKKVLKQKIDLFFKTYKDALKIIKNKKLSIFEEINSFFNKNNKYIKYTINKLSNISKYYHNQKKLYLENFYLSNEKIADKKKLEFLVEKNPEILKTNVFLKMYYYANKFKTATFFLSEKQPINYREFLTDL